MTYEILLGRDVQPETSDIWRYQPIDRLRDLLERRALFFPSLGTLSVTKDALEGELTELNYLHPEIEVERIWKDQLEGLNPPELKDTLERSFGDPEQLKGYGPLNRAHGYANCWYEGVGESHEMWRDFGHSHEGVVIKSVIGRLKRCFDGSPGHQYVDRALYLDLKLGGEPMPVDWTLALRAKDKQYSYQRELRAFMMAPDAETVFLSNDSGVFVPVLLHILIQKVILSPHARAGQDADVRAMLDKAGLKAVPVERSSFDS